MFRAFLVMTAKAEACNTCITPQAVYRNCRGAVYVTDRAGVPIGRRLSLRPQADLWPISQTQFDLPFNVSTPVLICRPRRDGRL